MSRAAEGAAYVPFCGDGDIAAELYTERRVYAADLDPRRVEVCRAHLPGARVIVADCNEWPFTDEETPPFAVADFDAYVHPYRAFLAFWHTATKAERLVLFFTDGHRQGIQRTGVICQPDGSRLVTQTLTERRRYYNFYWSQVIWPWFVKVAAGRRIIRSAKYLRGGMLYWGAIVDAKGTFEG